jgi:hypothetical protein
MTEQGGTPETSGEEASIDANVTIDEPTAPALDADPESTTEWEAAADVDPLDDDEDSADSSEDSSSSSEESDEDASEGSEEDQQDGDSAS